MNDYAREQYLALTLVRDHLASLSVEARRQLRRSIAPYLDFRRKVDDFLRTHFQSICTAACFQDRRSACCSKDGIITFFADHVINALSSDADALTLLADRLKHTHSSRKCVYLAPGGCTWTVRPLVCAMFLCDRAQAAAFDTAPEAAARWQALQQAAKGFRWPDRPVLFDDLEQTFMAAGHQSSLMYLNFSPGLLRIKALAGVNGPPSDGV